MRRVWVIFGIGFLAYGIGLRASVDHGWGWLAVACGGAALAIVAVRTAHWVGRIDQASKIAEQLEQAGAMIQSWKPGA